LELDNVLTLNTSLCVKYLHYLEETK
jgi:hypothetical protein